MCIIYELPMVWFYFIGVIPKLISLQVEWKS